MTKRDPDLPPPHDADAEAKALGCVLSGINGEPESFLDQLSSDHFYDERHKRIHSDLRLIHASGQVLSLVALHEWLKARNAFKDEAGEAFDRYVTELPDKPPSPQNFPTYLETLEEYRIRRAILHDAAEASLLARDTSKTARQISDAHWRLLETLAMNGNRREHLTIRTPNDLLALQFDDSDCILGDRLLAKGQSLVVAGAGSIGKSRLLLQLVAATAMGRDFIGLDTHAPGLRWLVLQAENSNRRLRADLASLRQWAGPDWARVNQTLLVHTLEATSDGFLSLDNPDAQRRIAQAIREHKPGVVAFDSLYNFGAGDLNSDQDMVATLLTISRLCKADNADRAIVILHHALTGKAGAARVAGYERSSFGRNSKVLHSWTRAQINLAPGSPDSNELLVVTCGKNSNGREFAPFAIRLNQETMIYEPEPDFDIAAWESNVAGRRERATITVDRVRELCQPNLSKKDLARRIMDDAGCVKQYAYRMISKAEKAKIILFSKVTEKYAAKTQPVHR